MARKNENEHENKRKERNSDLNLPRPTKVRNKKPAPVQVTAEQILRETQECQETKILPPKQNFTDASVLAEYRLQKRKGFEDQTRGSPSNIRRWIKYAQWEELQKDFERARSVWERCLAQGNNYRNPELWLKYANMEMKNKFINHARNILNRGVTLLPREDKLWIKFIHMEEMLGNVAGARQIFELWMNNWMPEQGSLDYLKFELRYNEIERARCFFERYVEFCKPSLKADAWTRFAKFELNNGEVGRARNCFERATKELDSNYEGAEQLFVDFAEFEESCKETKRAEVIYKYALDHLPKFVTRNLYTKFVAFQMRNGKIETIEDAVVAKRRFRYAEEVRENALDYDSWLGYIRLEESAGNKERIRKVYEQAISNVPPANEKRYWHRYIYLWINYALFEELEAQDMEKTRDVYMKCLNMIPHKQFSFAQIWILAAQFEIRQLNLNAARKILGTAIGMAPKSKIFKKYIELELQLFNIDACRKIYDKYLEWWAENCYAWCKYAEMEGDLKETERARAIFELAISQPALDMPELLWKAYIDFEISEGEFQRARELYGRLLDRTKHLNVWISCALFEASAMEEGLKESLHDEQKKQCLERARSVFDNADNYFRTSKPEQKEERAMLLEEWMKMEYRFDNFGDIELVRVKLPKKVKKRRQIVTENGPAGYEEHIDYIFPEETQTTTFKLLEAAYKWKNQKSELDSDSD